MTRTMATFMALYFALLIFGGVWDGALLLSGDKSDVNAVGQLQVLTNPFDSVGINPVSWFAAGIEYLSAWAGILTFNFSFFQGPMQVIRWALVSMIGVPIIFEFARGALGR